MVMTAKVSVRCDVNDGTLITDIESIVGTAIANALADAGHPGNSISTIVSITPAATAAGVVGPKVAAVTPPGLANKP